MKGIVFIWLLFFVQISFGQLQPIETGRKSLELDKFNNYYANKKIHWGIQPLTYQSLKKLNVSFEDTLVKVSLDKQFKRNQFKLAPIVDFGIGSSIKDSKGSISGRSELGLSLTYNIDSILSIGLFGRSGMFGPIVFGEFNEAITSGNVLPGIGRPITTFGSTPFYFDWGGHITAKPYKFLELSVGKGKPSVGEGYRSVLLSDNVANYPYGSLKINFWNIEYSTLYSFLTDYSLVENGNVIPRPKYATSHTLSYNATKWLNFTIFESVIWFGKDSISKRGYDFTYLNPVIFLRPTEYAIGSGDNAVLGGGFSIKPFKWMNVYSYALFDEFNFQELKKREGWWANKFALQVGVKMFDLFKVEGLHMQFEFNMARPFTYTHGETYQNYAHKNQSMAHPLGANFYEVLNILEYHNKRWIFRNELMFIAQGHDYDDEVSYGGDILKSYTDRNTEYGHHILQGDKYFRIVNSSRLSYVLDKKTNLEIFTQYNFRYQDDNGTSSIQNALQIGIKTRLFKEYLNVY